MNDYLIPANTKKGELIFGLFRPVDLILLGTGVGITLLLLMMTSLTSTTTVILVLSPALVCGFLVMPVPYYHNMLIVITECFEFFSHRQKYIWKGWCAISDEKRKK